MKLYVYGLAEGIDSLEDTIRGISGAPVHLLKIEDLAVLVSDFTSDTVPVTRENALGHAAVVRSILDRTTPLPFRFGTMVTEQQLRSFISARKSALESNLALVRDCVEMSVKIIWELSNNEPASQASQKTEGAGITFLKEKQREILGGELKAKRAEEISAWLRKTVHGLTRDEKVTLRPANKLFLATAHLVQRANITLYRQIIAAAVEERSDLRFLLSGPWPPYSFANIELEFNTQFGVS